MTLWRMQDRVPPFPTEAALEVMEQAWGRPVSAVLAQISDEPVAAASLGQVHGSANFAACTGGCDITPSSCESSSSHS